MLLLSDASHEVMLCTKHVGACALHPRAIMLDVVPASDLRFSPFLWAPLTYRSRGSCLVSQTGGGRSAVLSLVNIDNVRLPTASRCATVREQLPAPQRVVRTQLISPSFPWLEPGTRPESDCSGPALRMTGSAAPKAACGVSVGLRCIAAVGARSVICWTRCARTGGARRGSRASVELHVGHRPALQGDIVFAARFRSLIWFRRLVLLCRCCVAFLTGLEWLTSGTRRASLVIGCSAYRD